MLRSEKTVLVENTAYMPINWCLLQEKYEENLLVSKKAINLKSRSRMSSPDEFYKILNSSTLKTLCFYGFNLLARRASTEEDPKRKKWGTEKVVADTVARGPRSK